MLGAMSRFEEENVAQQLILRITDLEMLFTHLQRTVQDLDQVVVRHERRLDALEQAIQHLRSDAEDFLEVVEDQALREDEQPPHY
jgi:uncharacterized coiled-coil protein SlyX